MNKIKLLKNVYSYYLPEVRKVVDGVVSKFPHDLYLKSVFPGLDDFHEPIIKKFVKAYSFLKGLNQFKFRYYVNGSSEAIFHVMSWIKTMHKNSKIYVASGEYEGYRAYATKIGLEIVEVRNLEKLKKMTKGFVFISNPSAINGNIIENRVIKEIADVGHKIIYDGAYFGMTRRYVFGLDHPNIIVVMCSFSKPFGIFYYRVGFMFSRVDIESLYANKWFKNIFSLLVIDRLIDSKLIKKIYSKYKKVQERALNTVKKDWGIKLRSSDVFILGYLRRGEYNKLPKSKKILFEGHKRGEFYRFCLTPYFIENFEKTTGSSRR